MCDPHWQKALLKKNHVLQEKAFMNSLTLEMAKNSMVTLFKFNNLQYFIYTFFPQSYYEDNVVLGPD